jgi:5-methylcytosine-specific restriction protein A
MAKTKPSALALLKTIDRTAVEAAIAEYRATRDREAFLARHGRGKRSDYNLMDGGDALPSKAIVSAAYRHMTGEKLVGFSGGMSGAAGVLVALGFEVDDVSARNPDWDEDELTLALDLYRRVGLAGETHPEVIELSSFLRAMGTSRYAEIPKSYRNTNGVKLKLANLRSGDPARTSQQLGMRRNNQLEAVVWAKYGSDPTALKAAVARIRAAAAALGNDEDDSDPANEDEANEGGVSYRLHRRIERSRKLRNKKIKQGLKADLALKCEVCAFSFFEAFGKAGAGFAEVHHTEPLHLPRGARKTKTKDLSILCANCHRMAHRGGSLRSIAELQALRAATGS